MKLENKVLLTFLAISIVSCLTPKRKGFSAENRSYTTDVISYSCQDEIRYLPAGMILELNELTLDAILNKATSQLNTVLGDEFISANAKKEIKEKLIEKYFSLEKKITNKTLMIGSNNLWNIKNPKKFFSEQVIYPKELNWKKMILCKSFEPLTFEKTIGIWHIKQTIVPCIGSNWSETGQFKKVDKRNNETSIFAEFQYQTELDVNIHLEVTNTENLKQEYYATSISDNPKGYSISNLSTRYALDGIEVPNPSNNEHKKIKVMTTFTGQ